MSMDPTELIEGEVSGGDEEEESTGSSGDSSVEVQATDETAGADPDGNEESVAE